MKELDVPAAQLTVTERDDFSLTLTRREKEEPQELFLYKVHLETTVHVLAESEEGAIGQAHCAVEDDGRSQTTAQVERVPFVIRGWSGNRF